MTDKELEHIYNEAYRPVYWTAYSFLKNDQDAEDVVQDTFISFITSYGDLKDTSKAVALLKKIAANKCLDRIKLTKTDAVEDEFFENIEAVPEDFLPESIIESEQMRKIVMDIIEKTLSEDIRRTLILFYFNELTTREISEALGVPQGTVLWRLNFAKKKIKKEVEKYEEENDTKLFMAVPFLTKLFIKEAEQVTFKPMPASFTNYLSASTKTFATEAAKKGAGIMSKKLIGIIAASVAVTAVIGGIAVIKNSSKSNPGSAQESNSIVSYESVAEQGAEETPPTLYPQDYLIPDVSMVFDGMTRDEVKTNLINILTVSQYTFGEGYGRRFGIESPDIYYSADFEYTWPEGTFDADACIYSIIAFLDIEDIITGTHGDMGDVILVVHCTDEAMAQMITEVGREIQEEYHLDPGYPQDSDYSLTEDGIYHCIMNLPIIVNE
ncbi:MAG: sigma-70 family RNA polymerase sigma factor [Clostridiales bacterium]|nr:sigma-70 family RNA polymerase sigma factor [Clostridiales bacterium]